MQKYLFIYLICALCFCACKTSKKGNWLKEDRQSVVNICVRDMKITFGKNTQAKYLGIIPSEIQNICTCFAQKAETKYLPHKYTQNEATEMMMGCFTKEIVGEKGNWNSKFKKNYTNLVKKQMEIKGEPTTEEQVLLDCFISKYEQEMDVFRLSDMPYIEQETKRLMENCVKDLD